MINVLDNGDDDLKRGEEGLGIIPINTADAPKPRACAVRSTMGFSIIADGIQPVYFFQKFCSVM